MKVENITKIYRTKTSEIKALDNISYEFIPGKMYAIMGHSGSGKSTLISILGLIDTYTSGKISIENKDVSKLKENELADLRMKHIGFVFQDFYLDEHLKAYENILADEPTGNLDEENEKLIFSILKDLSKQGKCVIVVTHSEEIKNYADEILTISKGKLEV